MTSIRAAARRAPVRQQRGRGSLFLPLLIVLTAGILSGCATSVRSSVGEPAHVADESSAIAGDAASPHAQQGDPLLLESRVDTIPGTTVTFEMIRVPGGTHTLPSGETVEIDPFWIQKTETTWDEFDVYALGLDLKTEEDREADLVIRPSKPYGAPDRGFGHSGYAAISMSFEAAMEYTRWLSLVTGASYRLPTVAEWQYACMAGGDADPGADETSLDERAWYWDNAFDKTHPVASLAPNPFGLHDLLGNALEWCDNGTDVRTGCGGSYNDRADAISCFSVVEQTPRWQESDPQIPKSIFWLTDAPFIGFRVVRDE